MYYKCYLILGSVYAGKKYDIRYDESHTKVYKEHGPVTLHQPEGKFKRFTIFCCLGFRQFSTLKVIYPRSAHLSPRSARPSPRSAYLLLVFLDILQIATFFYTSVWSLITITNLF